MGRFICKLEGKYFEYSTVVDAPITEPMTLAELEDYVREEDGRTGLSALPGRLARCEAKGTSARDDDSIDHCLFCNRAGKDETMVSFDTFKRWARGEITDLRDVVGYVFPEEDDGGSGWDWFTGKATNGS